MQIHPVYPLFHVIQMLRKDVSLDNVSELLEERKGVMELYSKNVNFFCNCTWLAFIDNEAIKMIKNAARLDIIDFRLLGNETSRGKPIIEFRGTYYGLSSVLPRPTY